MTTRELQSQWTKKELDAAPCCLSVIDGRILTQWCAGERHRDNVLQSLGASVAGWAQQVKREKAVYHTLNKLSVDVTRKVLVAEAWCPVSAKPRVQQALRDAAQTSSASVRLWPP